MDYVASFLATTALFLGALILYFFPFLLAIDRQHRQTRAIGILNLLTGWTFIGWVGAFVWSYTKKA